jgi:hypothetical protein
MSNSAVFRHLIDEHLDQDFEKRVVPDQRVAAGVDQSGHKNLSNPVNSALMEEDVYKKYLLSAGGMFWVPIILSLLLLNEAGNGMFLFQIPFSMAYSSSAFSVGYAVPWFLDRKLDTTFQEWSLHGGLRGHWYVFIRVFHPSWFVDNHF